jgi:hypothetical protein
MKASSSPTENPPSSTRRAPSQITRILSTPRRSALAVRNISRSLSVVSWRLTVSTSRLSQIARRSSWPLNSLMVRMPRKVSRKWLSRRAPQTIASADAWRRGVYEAQRRSA